MLEFFFGPANLSSCLKCAILSKMMENQRFGLRKSVSGVSTASFLQPTSGAGLKFSKNLKIIQI